MWMKGTGPIKEYRLKDTNEMLLFAECPKCDTGMLVLPHVLEGIPTDSDGVIVQGIRGI